MLESMDASTKHNNWDICFLPVRSKSKLSRRDIELAHSSARSHIAKIRHQRQKRSISGAGRKDNSSPRPLSTTSTPPTVGKDGQESLEAIQLSLETYQHDLVSPGLSYYRPNAWSLVSPSLTDPNTLNLWEYATTVVWPGFNPAQEALRLHWEMSLSANVSTAVSQAQFHVNMWQSAVHHSLRTRTDRTIDQSIYHYRNAVSLISQMIWNDDPTISELAVLFIIKLMLSPWTTSKENEDSGISGFGAPFPDAQWLSVISLSPFVEQHAHAMYHAVNLNGGLAQLRIPAIKYAVIFVDLLHCTFSLRPPSYLLPFVIERYGNRNNWFGYRSMFRAAGVDMDSAQHDSEAITILLSHRLSSKVYEVLKDMRAWTRVLQQLSQGASEAVDMLLLSLHRSIMQHRLLSTLLLPPPLNPHPHDNETTSHIAASGHAESAVTQIVRIGLLLFAARVTFPISNLTFHLTLAINLKELLTQHLSTLLDRELFHLLIWVCMLGALASVRTLEVTSRSYFINILKRTERARQQYSRLHDLGPRFVYEWSSECVSAPLQWLEVRDKCLSPFLWHEEACDAAAEAIWKEVQSQLEIEVKTLGQL